MSMHIGQGVNINSAALWDRITDRSSGMFSKSSVSGKQVTGCTVNVATLAGESLASRGYPGACMVEKATIHYHACTRKYRLAPTEAPPLSCMSVDASESDCLLYL